MEQGKTANEFDRAAIEDFLYHEAYLLDEWQLDEWGQLLTEDAKYYVPPNDVPNGNPNDTLFHVADDIERIKSRIKRLKSRHAHAENPHSRTRRLITNVRITERTDELIHVSANFLVMRYRRNEQIRQYVGVYKYKLAIRDGKLKIAERKAILDSEELGALGSISILL
ncbi:aromatic-ring-hydroxylating dioxygenase subunit beta [Paenibacillus alginolyticus]|uniref:Aromatic-ring-hydroxylating dioxygenase subunit beta n=1 Tax=Paenibacillus alginolyticus TaxID=59839 RepID=A0ABT4GHG3_9BACL|nr:aromatic-ring-hydroxylating dioxygenase subunit beta [Paenibacillus alginolyticus]MCY9666792.1 aromatic-ring-hydroxylating dioxygenase subunit beta [Paenibacillus alginolyticus]MCY9695478.1 aromatic-ring-hydroxylating dioxygenase subunit beta [Paenibacillus alginolyticus]MEC0146339.1 aromatic-ring-hydroxylating dioxygenase subunit beta [Paenibacillus alginolyticus]